MIAQTGASNRLKLNRMITNCDHMTSVCSVCSGENEHAFTLWTGIRVLTLSPYTRQGPHVLHSAGTPSKKNIQDLHKASICMPDVPATYLI